MVRFIPAVAGNTSLVACGKIIGAVHPRGRGEHSDIIKMRAPTAGSSPRSRGTLSTSDPLFASWRFIPAVAGNTSPAVVLAEPSAVHPRGRGEHSGQLSAELRASGSSPRSRGTPRLFALGLSFRRFIPAVAGNTNRTAAADSLYAVHPRGRGEHPPRARYVLPRVGSSPRSRGTLVSKPAELTLVRFIPAVAGNTQWKVATALAFAVHPRGRGEHRDAITSSTLGIGSSPRSRGTPPSLLSHTFCARFIPAVAGNTK